MILTSSAHCSIHLFSFYFFLNDVLWTISVCLNAATAVFKIVLYGGYECNQWHSAAWIQAGRSGSQSQSLAVAPPSHLRISQYSVIIMRIK